MKKVMAILLLCWGLVGCSLALPMKQDDEQKENLGYVEPITISTLIKSFNDQIFTNSGLGPTTENYSSLADGRYWFEITEGIHLVVIPKGEPKSLEEDIVASSHLYFEEEYINDPQVLAYTRMLIMANNDQISYDEAQNLIEEAQTLTSEKGTSNNGKGISVGFVRIENHYEYQIMRIYR